MNSTFDIIDEGMIAQQPETGPTAVAACSRCVIIDSDELVCTFSVQSALGQNDFKKVMVRSPDGGSTWSDPTYIWPHLHSSLSIIGSISKGRKGELILSGIQIPIDRAGESFWSEATEGMKQNALFFANSSDGGANWSDPTSVPLPIPGSAENPGVLTVISDGAWICCYSPYNNFDPDIKVDRNQVVWMRSEDEGKSWSHGSMLRFDNADSTAAEAWVIELVDGRLLGACWHIAGQDDKDMPNAYALSSDGGRTWTPTNNTGILGQSCALAALPDGRALLVYNQRKHGEPGIHLALARPTSDNFGLEINEPVWKATTRTRNNTAGNHNDWQDYAFGEPSVLPLPDGTVLVSFWKIQPDARGIDYVRVRLPE
ncbi:MAG: exo-alpha-sialidase [Candidatus Latescibacteria bacterium]|nr:exo-alpha-sialidase [Candidatus Latescibacterota bacterium]